MVAMRITDAFNCVENVLEFETSSSEDGCWVLYPASVACVWNLYIFSEDERPGAIVFLDRDYA
jgi:hypothetical protein